MIRLNLDDKINELIKYYMDSKEVILVSNELDEPLICYTNGAEVNNIYEYEEMDTYHRGGVYVSFKKDYIVCYFGDFEDKQNFIDYLLNSFVLNLKLKLPNEYIKCDGNDILINNKKFAGINYVSYYCFYISYDPDVDKINEICVKPSKKIPCGLVNFISREDLEKLLIECIEEFEKGGK